jgi:hypothetical protein
VPLDFQFPPDFPRPSSLLDPWVPWTLGMAQWLRRELVERFDGAIADRSPERFRLHLAMFGEPAEEPEVSQIQLVGLVNEHL